MLLIGITNIEVFAKEEKFHNLLPFTTGLPCRKDLLKYSQSNTLFITHEKINFMFEPPVVVKGCHNNSFFYQQ